MKTTICATLTLICALQATPARNVVFADNAGRYNSASPPATASKPGAPDLIVRGNEFEFVGNKAVNVYVSNNGDAASSRCVLELTVRKIGGVSAGRVKRATIPAIQPGKFVKIEVDATSILPAAVNLKDTTFKVVADATSVNAESNENNNEKWHNLN